MLQLLSVPVLNRYDLLDRMIDSIDYSVKEILIINNGEEKYIPKNKNFNFTILDLPSNIGCAGSWNLTVKLYPHLSFWSFASADIVWKSGSIEKMNMESGSDYLCLSTAMTSAFSIGENLIRKIGLFDENYYPIYYEYLDYKERINKNGLSSNIKYDCFEIDNTDNWTTVKSNNNFMKKNKITLMKNGKYLENKKPNYEDIPWSLDIRRENDWQK